MKVVIYKSYGSFTLSDQAIKMMVEAGFSVGGCEADLSSASDEAAYGLADDDSYFLNCTHRKEFRCDPRLVKIVEELGDLATSHGKKIKIVDIPFEDVNGWYIMDFDGVESIHEDHRMWG